MKRNYTLLYLLNTSQKNKGDLVWMEEDLSDVEDVMRMLEQLEVEPDPDVVERILNYAASS